MIYFWGLWGGSPTITSIADSETVHLSLSHAFPTFFEGYCIAGDVAGCPSDCEALGDRKFGLVIGQRLCS